MRRFRNVLFVLVLILLATGAFLVLPVPGRNILSRLTQKPPVVLFTCPLQTRATAVSEVAACTDCMYYPVDKQRQLSPKYQPKVVDTGLPGGGQVVPTVVGPLKNLFAAARGAGHFPVITSAYRSFDDQQKVFATWVYSEWQHMPNLLVALANTERYSAWPGHSEHQLGTTVDINCLTCIPFDRQDAKNLALWKFLEDNAHRYGFVLSYPREMESRTGYTYEPWHLRYVGMEQATALYEQGYTNGNGICLSAMLRYKQ